MASDSHSDEAAVVDRRQAAVGIDREVVRLGAPAEPISIGMCS